MTKEIKITLRVPNDAQSREDTPYWEHDKFIRYCNANKIAVNATILEQYEKSGLLYPCYRVLCPRELLRRDYKADRSSYNKNYKVLSEWEPLIELENSISKSKHWIYEKNKEYIENGHPLDQEIEKNNPYIAKPECEKFKAWDRYKVIVDKQGDYKIKKSRADYYYSPWKVFILQDLNELSIDRDNRAFGAKEKWGLVRKKVEPSPLNEFAPFFRTTTDFNYRRAILINNYHYNAKKRQLNWRQTTRGSS